MLKRYISLFMLVLAFWQAVAARAAAVTKIAAGHYHSLFLMSDGSLWAMGHNEYGQLGDGTTNLVKQPERIVSSNVVAISCGRWHSLFLKSDGSLWAMGDNEGGQLGDQTFNSSLIPEQIVSSGVVAIAAGGYHSLFIKSDGSLWAMGTNAYGQLGDGTTTLSKTPEQIVPSGVSAISAGYGHSLFLKSDGSLWATGFNTLGQLGDGTTNNQAAPERIVSSSVVAIAAGGWHSLFLKSDGSVWATGQNDFYQLGDNSLNNRTTPEQVVSNNVIAIAAGEDHSLLIKSDGTIWAAGDNYDGQLGTAIPGGGQSTPTQGYQFSALRWYTSNVVAIAAGGVHSLLIKSDGSLWDMGAGTVLGDGFSSGYYYAGGNKVTGFCDYPEQIIPRPAPVLKVTRTGGTNLQVKTICLLGGPYRLLTSTNLTQSSSNWMPIQTNVITLLSNWNYSVTLTNALSSGASQQFYKLQAQ